MGISKSFAGFSAEALQFFRDLSRNNMREWFQTRKEFYEAQVRGPMLDLVEAINGDLSQFSPEHVTEPAKAVYRIYRDTRFSKDKTPYKTHIGANFRHRQSQKHTSAGYYFHVSHEEIGIAAGIYMPEPQDLLTLRRVMSERFKEVSALLPKKLGGLQGEKLTRAPKGFLPDDPAVELLKMKQLYFWVTIDPQIATTRKLQKEIVDRFRLAAPFVQFVNQALQPGWKQKARAAEFLE